MGCGFPFDWKGKKKQQPFFSMWGDILRVGRLKQKTVWRPSCNKLSRVTAKQYTKIIVENILEEKGANKQDRGPNLITTALFYRFFQPPFLLRLFVPPLGSNQQEIGSCVFRNGAHSPWRNINKPSSENKAYLLMIYDLQCMTLMISTPAQLYPQFLSSHPWVHIHLTFNPGRVPAGAV